MHRFVWLASLSAICSLALPVSSGFASDLSEVSVTRTASTPSSVSAELTKNEYRYVERQEVYTVDVPYSVDVPYTEVETYYDRETRCGYRPVSRRVCHSETRCMNGVLAPVDEIRVRDHRSGQGGEGSTSTSSGGVVVRDHRRPRRECGSYPVCHTETSTEYECRTISVPRSRLVTRYRRETRYRAESRVRTVTDKIFDYAWREVVNVILPEEAQLQGSEQETILLQLTGSQSAPDVEVTVDSPVFSYRVADKQVQDNQMTVRLEMVAKYSPDMLGEQTLTGLSLRRLSSSGYEVQFVDRGVVARVTSDYIVKIADKDSGQWIFERQLSATSADLGPSREVRIPVDAPINHAHDHLIRVLVRRDGIVLSQPVVFQKDQHQVGQLDPAPYVDPNGVREFEITGHERAAQLVFLDATPNDGKVDTQYVIKLERRRLKFLWKTTIAQATVLRKDLAVAPGGRTFVPMSTFPGVSSRELEKFFDGGDKVFVEVAVTRVSPRLQGHSPVRFTKETQVRIR